MAQPARREPDAAPASDASPLRLRLLGEFELQSGTGTISVARAQQRVLAYLAVIRRPVSRALLSQQLSEEPDEDRGPSALRSSLWRLPRPAGLSLVHSHGSDVRLAPEVTVDLWDSERSAQHLHRPSALADAGAPTDPADWSHDLLPEWSDEWLVMERESYRQLRLHALERLSETLREMGQHASALMAALSAVRADPLRESAH